MTDAKDLLAIQNPQYTAGIYRWTRARDCKSGSQAMKQHDIDLVNDYQSRTNYQLTDRYILKPNDHVERGAQDCGYDDYYENQCRYVKLIELAQFFNATKRTLEAMIGAAFRKDPVLSDDLPVTLDYVSTDVDGSGLGIDQQAKQTLSDVLLVGRRFLLVDFPSTDGEVSAAQMQGGIRPRILSYPAEAVIDWNEETINGARVLNYVKICMVDTSVDLMTGEREVVKSYRILRLIDGVYTSQDIDEEGNEGEIIAPIASGSPLNFIPGVFTGATNNNPDVDDAPLYDLAEVNIGHYRNSADSEESSFISGQPTMSVTSDLDAKTWKEQNPNGVLIGSRRGHFLGVTGALSMVQAESTGLPRELMKDKEQQMIMLGAQLITPDTATETATGAKISSAQGTSVLSMAVKNVSAAYTQCLQWMQMFISSGEPVEAGYELNMDFTSVEMTAQDAVNWAAAVQQGTPQSIYFDLLREAGLTGKKDEELQAEIESQGVEGINLDSETLNVNA